MTEEKLKKIAISMGADYVGIGDAKIIEYRRKLLIDRITLEFESKNVQKRIDPFYHFKDAKSILAILVSYKLYTNNIDNNQIKVASSNKNDYHIVINNILKSIARKILDYGIKSVPICDTQSLLDREIAIKCGLGFFGKNTFIINQSLGSSHNIGYLLMDRSFKNDKIILRDCSNCNICVKACPQNAIKGDYTLDAQKCLSYISQSKTSKYTDLKGSIYGCDICQRVCPYNKVESYNKNFIFEYEDFEKLSNREFKRKFKNRDFAWIGNKIIKRNINWIKKERKMKEIHQLKTLQKKIEELKEQGVYRTLPSFKGPNKNIINLNGKDVINLCSNNYLGFADHPRLKAAAIKAIEDYGVGSGAVRTIVGNMDLHEKLEEKLAKFKKEEAVMLYQSGFNCNAGTIQAITQKGDLIISDELNHASIIDGVRLSRADKRVFKHSDMEDLENILIETEGKYETTLIITDGVFSMDGDLAKLPEIVELAEKYSALTYVDDAHGSGVLGENGRGTVDHFGLHGRVDFIIGTLSKALGVIGGYVAGNNVMKEWLSHRGRPILFSTSLPPAVLGAVIEAIDLLSSTDEFTNKMWENANYFKEKISEKGFDIGDSKTPITPVIIGDEAKSLEFSKALLDEGVFVSAIVFPTVPKGTGRLRCMITAEHTKEDLDTAVEKFYKVAKKINVL